MANFQRMSLSSVSASIFLADAYGMDGRPEEGLKVLAEFETSAELARRILRGTLLSRAVRAAFVVARQHRRRRGLAQRHRRDPGQTAKFLELLAAIDLARLWMTQRKRAEARDLLAPIYGWFTEGLDTPVLMEAKALLDKLGGD